MPTHQSKVDYICEQMQAAGVISARKMFGEYGVYCDGKLVGLICDGQLFLKPTPSARALLGDAPMGPPYPGAKPQYLIDEGLDDADQLARVVAVVAAEVNAPAPKKPGKAKAK